MRGIPTSLGKGRGGGGAGLGGTESMPARVSEEEKRSQTDHKTLYLSKVLLLNAGRKHLKGQEKTETEEKCLSNVA